MIRQEAILQSPLRILDRALRGGLGKGRLGAIVGPAGIGKSACLTHLGLDASLRARPGLHVAVGQSVEHVSAAYDALYEELAERVGLADRGGVREWIARRRLIWSVAGSAFGPRSLDEAIAAFEKHLGLEPATLLVDGFDREGPPDPATLPALKAIALRIGAEIWVTARALPGGAADVVLRLEPHARHVRVLLLDRGEGAAPLELPLVLEGSALRAGPADDAAPAGLPAEAFTLVATGSAGAEEEFGACAERWGLQEIHYTFRGRGAIARTRGVVELGDDELRVGEVSTAYVRAHLHRTLPETPALGHVLQVLWHEVNAAGEVFAVGALHADKTAHGGTGWAVELARHWGKPVHLFDQARERWFRWDARDWIEESPPVITRTRFAGTGTRSLSDAGRAAIRGLFERSFGPPPA